MDNAIAQTLPSAVAPGARAVPVAEPGFVERLAALPAKRKLMLGTGLAALAAIVIAMVMMNSQGDYKVLYANLSEKDGGAVIAQLSQMNVPYKYAEGGAAILVPAAVVHDVRLKLASAGLPKGSVVGFELMDNARFGITQFQERLTFQRGLEGELTRSITALSAVQAARVHLALPNQNGFFREQQKPSASVMLTLHPGRTLDRAQVAGIVHLVSSSVPELSPKAVSVLDQTGALLSGSPEGGNGGLDAQQLQYVNQIEANHTKRILDILEPVVGRDNLRAQVTAEVDFSQTESTSEEFKPNQGQAPAAVRSHQQSSSTGGGSAQPNGVPGATSNQPPVPATAPINGPAQQLQAAQGGNAASAGPSRSEAVTNYEVDKTVRVTRNATGTVKRLNAAVVLNHRAVTDAKGKTTYVPLGKDELEKLTALVQETIGFNQERGDSVKVINAPFKVEKVDAPDTPLWKQPELLDLLRTAVIPGALTLLALIVVFGAIRPALKAAQSSRPAPMLDAVVDDAQTLPGAGPASALPALEAPQADNRLDEARRLAKDNPGAVASIVRGWVTKDA